MNVSPISLLDVHLFLSTLWSNLQTAFVAEAVICNITTDPVSFRKTVVITCQSLRDNICDQHRKRIWSGDHGVLFLNGIPSQLATRFQETIESCHRFSLEISNFSEADIGSKYSCYVGFKKCETQILLSTGNFIYSPTEEEISSVVNKDDDYLYVNISVSKIHPLPDCSALYDMNCVENISQQIQPSGPFNSLNLKMRMLQRDCQPVVNVSCQLANDSITLFSLLTNNSLAVLDKTKYSKELDCIIVMIVTILFCIGALSQSICRNIKKLLMCLKQLPKRPLLNWRRPLLGMFFVFCALVFVCTLVGLSFCPDYSKNCENATPVSIMISAVFFSNVSMGFISNPDTISIRQGFTKSIQRFKSKWTLCCNLIQTKTDHDKNDLDKFGNSQRKEEDPFL